MVHEHRLSQCSAAGATLAEAVAGAPDTCPHEARCERPAGAFRAIGCRPLLLVSSRESPVMRESRGETAIQIVDGWGKGP